MALSARLPAGAIVARNSPGSRVRLRPDPAELPLFEKEGR